MLLPVKALVATLINIHLITIGYKPRREVVNAKGWSDCVFDMPEFELTVVFEKSGRAIP